MPPVAREQLDKIETSLNTRQDRNTLLTGGGLFTWDAGTGTLAWSQDLEVRVGGLDGAGGSVVTVPSGSIANFDAEDEAWYVVFGRTTGVVSSSGKTTMTSETLNADNVLVLGVRGADGYFYLRDGTVLGDGDTGHLGTWSPSVDREVVTAPGTATISLSSITYAFGTGQLLVIVGGITQELGHHYDEVDGGTTSTDIEFNAGHIPASGERVVFIVLTGGRGLPGPSAARQDAYDNGPDVAVVSGTPMQNTMSGGTDKSVVEQWGGSGGGATNLKVLRDGTVRGRAVQVRDSTNPSAEEWEVVSLAGHWVSWNSDNNQAFRVKKDGTGFEYGTCDGTTFTPASPPAGTTTASLRTMPLAGTLDDAGPTLIAWPHSTPYGMTLLAFNAAGSVNKFVGIENSGFATGGSELYLLFDDLNNRIVLSGDLAGTAVVGANYQNQDFRLVVFY